MARPYHGQPYAAGSSAAPHGTWAAEVHVFQQSAVASPEELYRAITGQAPPPVTSLADAGGAASLGAEWPPEDDDAGAENEPCAGGEGRARKKRKVNRTAKRSEIWTPRAELAFCWCISYIPPNGRTKIKFMGRPLGRNELIAAVCTLATDLAYNRKQISSHSQVLKDKVAERFKPLLTFDDKARAGGDDQSSVIERYRLPKGLLTLMGCEHIADIAVADGTRLDELLSGQRPSHASSSRSSFSGGPTIETQQLSLAAPLMPIAPPPHQLPVAPVSPYPAQPPRYSYPASLIPNPTLAGTPAPVQVGPSSWASPTGPPHQPARRSSSTVGYGHHRTNGDPGLNQQHEHAQAPCLSTDLTAMASVPKFEPGYVVPAASYWEVAQLAVGDSDWNANRLTAASLPPLALAGVGYSSPSWAELGDAAKGPPRYGKSSSPYGLLGVAAACASPTAVYRRGHFTPCSFELTATMPGTDDERRPLRWMPSAGKPLRHGEPLALGQISMWEARYPFLRDMIGAGIDVCHIDVPINVVADVGDRSGVFNAAGPLCVRLAVRTPWRDDQTAAAGVDAPHEQSVTRSLVTDSSFLNIEGVTQFEREHEPLRPVYDMSHAFKDVDAQTSLNQLTAFWRHMANVDCTEQLHRTAPVPGTQLDVAVPNTALVQMVVRDADLAELLPPDAHRRPIGHGWRAAELVVVYSFYVLACVGPSSPAAEPVARLVDLGVPPVSHTLPLGADDSHAAEQLIRQLDVNEQQRPSGMVWSGV
ncbi:hypothetical protein Q5752_003489 [Cryptotrichosporon argae]